MSIRLTLSVLLLVTLATGLPGQAKWWEEDSGSLAVLEERTITETCRSRLNWADGYLEITAGATCDVEKAKTKAHCYSMSVKTARHLAMERMSEIIYGVRIDSDNLFINEVEFDAQLKSSTQGLIKGAREIAMEQTEFDDGSIWVEVTMGMTLHGEKGLSSVVVPWMEQKAKTTPSRLFNVAAGQTSISAPSDDFTGLIVEGSGLNLKPALAPRILVEGRDEELYGRVNVDRAAAIKYGIVGYTDSIDKAKTLLERVGPNPMVVKAAATAGAHGSDVLLTVNDAARVMSANMKGEFLKECRVVFVVG